MALNQLSDRLDQISVSELGFEFDDSAVWTKLEGRLNNSRTVVYWRAVAACMLLLTLFLPISLLKEIDLPANTLSEIEGTSAIENSDLIQAPMIEDDLKKPDKPTWKLDKKGIEPIQLAKVTANSPALQPIEFEIIKVKKPTFTGEDISIIQASLETPKVGKGRKMTIRAQWQKSPTKSNVEHQALKVKLYEKNE
ncbi:hypothetical protein [Ekhidna sp.]